MSCKMYIGVREGVPDNMVPVLVGHSVLNHHLAMIREEECLEKVLYYYWLQHSFKKCVVSLSEGAWHKAIALPGAIQSHENKTLQGLKSCVTLVVKGEEIPNVFKFAPLWRPEAEKHASDLMWAAEAASGRYMGAC